MRLGDFDSITTAVEDQAFFRLYSRDSGYAESRRILSEFIELLGFLHNVQDAEAQEVRARREGWLNRSLIVLAFLTLVSVTADAYNFVRDQENIIPSRDQRVQVLIGLLLSRHTRPPATETK
jgi:hypothetical protein